jgi:Cid1 family poly A polymerase
VGQLFLEFLVFYATFDYESEVISIKRHPERLRKCQVLVNDRWTSKRQRREEAAPVREDPEHAEEQTEEQEETEASDVDTVEEEEEKQETDANTEAAAAAPGRGKETTWEDFTMCLEDPFEHRNLAGVITLQKLNVLRLVCAITFLALQRYSITDLFGTCGSCLCSPVVFRAVIFLSSLLPLVVSALLSLYLYRCVCCCLTCRNKHTHTHTHTHPHIHTPTYMYTRRIFFAHAHSCTRHSQ